MATNTPTPPSPSAFHRPRQHPSGHVQPSRHVDECDVQECGPSHQSLAVLLATPQRRFVSEGDLSQCPTPEQPEFGGDLDLAEILLLVALGQAGKGCSSILQCLSSDLLRYQVAPQIAVAHDESRRRAGLKTPEQDVAPPTPMSKQPIAQAMAPPRIVRPLRTRQMLPDEAILRDRAQRILAFGPVGFSTVLAGHRGSPQVGAMPGGSPHRPMLGMMMGGGSPQVGGMRGISPHPGMLGMLMGGGSPQVGRMPGGSPHPGMLGMMMGGSSPQVGGGRPQMGGGSPQVSGMQRNGLVGLKRLRVGPLFSDAVLSGQELEFDPREVLVTSQGPTVGPTGAPCSQENAHPLGP
ncbi:hypothetical protein T484DRAFT_3194081 [Baffinella frigidus]|nr:hypothetical protein T484DRAFT_3194081 [Cryptophyta sp. CCMP2293]